MVCEQPGMLLAALCLAEMFLATLALRSPRDGVRMASGKDRFARRHEFGAELYKDGSAEPWESEDYPFDPLLTSGPSRGLHGKNLLLVGDSNDRKFIHFMCAQYGGNVEYVDKMACGDQVLKFPAFHNKEGQTFRPSATYFCHVPAHNMSIMQFFHFGAMSMAPSPKWHSDTLVLPGGPCYHLPKLSTGASLNVSAADLPCFWRSAIARELPQRPSVVVAQSSLWDSVLARDYLVDHGFGPPALQQDGLGDVGWKRTTQQPGLAAWDWIEHASAFMETLRGLGAQKLYWRTNANCPLEGDWNGFVASTSDAMAVEVRKALAVHEGIWSEVGLIDWNKDFVAVDVAADCIGVHYTARSYATLLDSIQKTLDEAD